MNAPKAADVKRGISALWETLQCPICLDLITTPVSTKCDHQFCKFCMLKLLDNSKQNQASCPVCKAKITKRSLQESPGFQRLVAGLQDMITAYEHDTGTNYFTGTCQHKGQKKVTEDAGEHQQDMMSGGSPEAESKEHPVDDLPKSHSSTIAALNGFADLMGFGDTSPLTTENEGLDSGLGEAPPTSDKKIHSITHVDTEMVEVTENTTAPHKMGVSVLGEGFTEPPVNPDDTKPQTVRKLSRKRNKKDLKTNKILEEKQKRSMEKVAEWLLKVPTEGSLELENLNKVDGDSDSCSSSSTIVVRQHNTDTILSRREQAKALEDQVFGAVYRRERKNNRAVFPPLDHFNQLKKTKEEKGAESVSGEKSASDTEERLQEAEEKKGNSSDVLEDELMVDDYREQIAENENNNGKEEAPDRRRQPGRNSKKRTRNTVQQVDSDLLQQAQATSQIPKRSNKKKSQNLRSEKGKSASAAKPLELVAVQNEETDPVARPRSEDVQVHIENYPSSEDKELPSKRSTRRSRRLQVFTDTIRGGRSKAKSNIDSSEKETSVSKQPDETGGASLDRKTSPNTATEAKDAERNGCVCNEDLGGIENMEAGGMPQENVKEQISEVANAERLPEGSAARDPAVPSSASPAEVAVGLTQCPPNSTRLDAPVSETPGAGREDEEEEEEEEDRNDSELDTEQLLRSFKGTKRKSFHLGGGPSVKRSRGADQGEVHVLGGRTETRARTPEAVEGSGLGDCEDFSVDVISPSISPRRVGKPVLEEAHRVAEDESPGQDGALSVSSPLPPNIQSKRRDGDSSCPSVEPRVGDSGLYFVSVEQELADGPSTRPQTAAEPRPHRGERDETDDRNSPRSEKLSAEQIANQESSLTPDGLGMPAGENSQRDSKTWRSSSCSQELSGLSPIKSTARRRTRRLRSTSESSDCTGDALPSLAEMFGGPAPAGTPDQGGSSREARQEAVDDVEEQLSPEVQSSQASVDLFGTPEEGEAAANDPCASAESSQLSSDVLVTQQKLEMQKELARLEKLMALVSEVLQEKEGSPVREVPPKTDQSCKDTDSSHVPLTEDQDSTSERKPVPEVQQELGTRSSEVKGLQQDTGSKPGGPAELTPRPAHSRPSVKDAAASRTLGNDGSPSENKENDTPVRERSRAKTVLVSSGLDPHQQGMVKRFAKQVGARVASKVTAETTHVVVHTVLGLVNVAPGPEALKRALAGGGCHFFLFFFLLHT
ncbi:uncharacterized protein LOC142889393 isoform X3 [Nelusetta ayraudi]|uniref:uncharacterized protein LOC142889393 isoform X3 n=1 Tax=Nelusetta ayraudi TaxID=303726 RepID=UPI003F6FAB32